MPVTPFQVTGLITELDQVHLGPLETGAHLEAQFRLISQTALKYLPQTAVGLAEDEEGIGCVPAQHVHIQSRIRGGRRGRAVLRVVG